MAKRIITISREFGSGGRFIGEEVAQQLGIPIWIMSLLTGISFILLLSAIFNFSSFFA